LTAQLFLQGFGFVNFLTPEMVDIAVQPGMVYELCDKRVEVKRAQVIAA
jgi:hypothetical protein